MLAMGENTNNNVWYIIKVWVKVVAKYPSSM